MHAWFGRMVVTAAGMCAAIGVLPAPAAARAAAAPQRADAAVTGVAAWGDDDYGESAVPAQLSGVVAVAAGQDHSLALRGDGTVVAWGHDTFGEATVPAGLTNVIAIAAGYNHSLALRSDGTVVGWGLATSGQITPPAGLSGVTAIAAGGSFSLALRNDGTVVAWGDDLFGQTEVPVGLGGVIAIAAGTYHSLAVRSDGTVVQWGGYEIGTPQGNHPAPPAGLTNVIAVAGGRNHSLALRSDGTVVAWGHIGAAVVPAGLTGVTAIAAGQDHSLARRADGTVVGWLATDTAGPNGWADSGQAMVPADLTGVTAIAAGARHSLAVVVATVPVITTQPVDQTALAGTPITLRVASSGYPLPQVQWEWSSDGVTFTPALEGTGATLVLTARPADDGIWLRAVLTNPAGSVTSSAARLTIVAEIPATGNASAPLLGIGALLVLAGLALVRISHHTDVS